MSDEADRETDRPDETAEWRRAYREALPAGTAGCPSDEELASLLLGEVEAGARMRLADHLVSCRRCVAAYRTLAELQREAAGEPAPAGRWPLRRLAGWAAAAALLVAAGLALVALPPVERDGEVVRGPADAAKPVDPPHGARLAAPPRRLTWAEEADGAIYRVVVYDEESAPLWESERTRRPILELPATVRDRLATGGTFYWRVRIEGESGRGATPLYRFEVAR
jgi:hypothetical protein